MTSVMIAGRFDGTFAHFYLRCDVLLAEEQAKPNPDNALIAVLCDAVRITREHVELLRAPRQDERPAKYAKCHRCQRNVLLMDDGKIGLHECDALPIAALENNPPDALIVHRLRAWVARWITNQDKSDPWYHAAEELSRTMFTPMGGRQDERPALCAECGFPKSNHPPECGPFAPAAPPKENK